MGEKDKQRISNCSAMSENFGLAIEGRFLAKSRPSSSNYSFNEIRLNGKLHDFLTRTKKDCKVFSQKPKSGE